MPYLAASPIERKACGQWRKSGIGHTFFVRQEILAAAVQKAFRCGCARADDSIIWRKTENGRKIECIFGEGACRKADGQICGPLYYFPAGGRSVQYCGSDFHCQCRLSGVLWECGKYSGFPFDSGCACHRCSDWRWLLCVCEPVPGKRRTGEGAQEHRERRAFMHWGKHCADGHLSGIPGWDTDPVRRPGK